MTDRLLRLHEIGELLGTSPKAAAKELTKMGVYPIDFGVGRGKGYRWLESAVMHALGEMQAMASAKHGIKKKISYVPSSDDSCVAILDQATLPDAKGTIAKSHKIQHMRLNDLQKLLASSTTAADIQ